MIWLMNYFRQVFCKHEYTYDETEVTVTTSGYGKKQGLKISMLCKKCGYHRNTWKYI